MTLMVAGVTFLAVCLPGRAGRAGFSVRDDRARTVIGAVEAEARPDGGLAAAVRPAFADPRITAVPARLTTVGVRRTEADR